MTTTSDETRPGGRPAWHRDVLSYIASRFLWVASDQIVLVAVGWTVYDETDSAWALGLVGLAAFVPRLLVTLVSGMVADHYDRRTILGVGLGVNAAVSLTLMMIVLQTAVPVAMIYAMFLIFGTVRGFVTPASQALIANLVPRAEFSRIVGLNSSTSQVARILGPSLGGFIFVLGAWAPFAVAAVCYCIAMALNLSLRTRGQAKTKAPPKFSDAFAGLSFIFRRPVILGAVSMDLFAVLLGGAVALLPIIAKDLLDAGPLTLGLLRAMPSAGAAMLGFGLAFVPLKRRVGPKLFIATAIFGLATIGLGLSTNLWLTMAFLWVIGASDVFSVVIRQTLVQANTPDEMRGRVAAVNTLFIGASNELGEFESGATAALFGLVPAIILGGAGTVLVAGLWAVLFPDLRRRDWLVDG